MLKTVEKNVADLVDALTFKEKVERSLTLIGEACEEYGEALVVANSLGKDSMVVWDLAKRVSRDIRGFVVATPYKPQKTVDFMCRIIDRYPEINVYESEATVPDRLYERNPDKCCELLKVEPTRKAIEDMEAECWITGLRCTEGRTRTDYLEVEERDRGLIKLNPILIWHEREVWQYLALNDVPVNPLYREGYRSLGCAPCTNIVADPKERAGRWIGTSKCGGECGMHTRPLSEPPLPK